MTTLDVTGLPEDRVKYLEQLVQSWRQENAVGAALAKTKEDTADGAWQQFFRIGDALADGDTEDAGTLTAAVLSMRR